MLIKYIESDCIMNVQCEIIFILIIFLLETHSNDETNSKASIDFDLSR